MAKKSWYARRIEAKKEAKKVYPPDHRHSDYWCERHWAPYRVPGESGVLPNGRAAAVLISQEFFATPEYLGLPDVSEKPLRAHLAAQEKPLCCRLGDEVMDRVLSQAIRFSVRKEGHEDRETPA